MFFLSFFSFFTFLFFLPFFLFFSSQKKIIYYPHVMFDLLWKHRLSNHYGTLRVDDQLLDFDDFELSSELLDEREDDDFFFLFFDLLLFFFLLPLDFFLLLLDSLRPLLRPLRPLRLSTSRSTASNSLEVTVSSICSSSSASQTRNWFAS